MRKKPRGYSIEHINNLRKSIDREEDFRPAPILSRIGKAAAAGVERGIQVDRSCSGCRPSDSRPFFCAVDSRDYGDLDL